MKISTFLVAGAAFAAGVDAQRPHIPDWLLKLLPGLKNIGHDNPYGNGNGKGNPFGKPSNNPNGNPNGNLYTPQVTTVSVSSVTPGAGFPFAGRLGNSNIPVGQTHTAVATSFGSQKSIVPTIPTFTANPFVPPGVPSTSGTNSTTNGTLVSCAQDAKNRPWLPNTPNSRCNWSPGFDINTDVETSWPKTGNTVRYTLTVTNGTIAPQGDQKIGFLINGQSPGPKIEANWGDTLEITVINNLQHNGTSIHWHGFQQKGTNTFDGVGGITECPIAPGDKKVYKFVATSYGTTWYHSHFSAQYSEGVLGPLVINGPTSYNYDLDLGTVTVSDYYPLTGCQEAYLAARFGPPTSSNYLLNGKNIKLDGSSGERSKWQFQPGKKHKIRLINTSTDHHFKIQLDQHSMIVVASDFVAINPYRTNELAIAIGQRYDIIVEANQAPGNYWFRALSATDCSSNLNNGTGTANGVISYAGASSGLPTSQLTVAHDNTCVDEPLAALKPMVTKSVDSSAFAAIASTLPVNLAVVTTNNDTVFQWNIGGVSQVIDWADPTIVDAVAKQNNYETAKNVIILPNANTWTFWVLQNQFFVPHPMHLHGHDFAILGTGNGVFSAANDFDKLNFKDPARRDVVELIAQGWTVIAFRTDNPGAWLMHCHIAFHVGDGLSLQFLERPNDIPNLYSSAVQSSAFQNTCANWKKYAPNVVYQKQDSGLKRRDTVGDIELHMEVLDELPERRRDTTATKAHLDRHIRREVSHWGTQAL